MAGGISRVEETDQARLGGFPSRLSPALLQVTPSLTAAPSQSISDPPSGTHRLRSWLEPQEQALCIPGAQWTEGVGPDPSMGRISFFGLIAFIYLKGAIGRGERIIS